MVDIFAYNILGQREDENQSNCDENNKRLTLAYEKLIFFPKSLKEQFCNTTKILDISHNNFR